MVVYFENFGAHVLKLSDLTGWRLWVDMNEHEESMIMLETEGRVFEVCNCWEIIQGEKLCSYDVLAFLNAVVMRVFEILNVGGGVVEYINIEEIKHSILPSFWDKWKDFGKVEHSMPYMPASGHCGT